MKYDLISLDMQGTVTDSRFSDTFWREVLPSMYAKRFSVPLEVGKQNLGSLFKEYGSYDYRYYDWKYWVRLWGLPYTFTDITRLIGIHPAVYPGALQFIKKAHGLGIPLIITSSTSHDFITEELGPVQPLFQEQFSSLEDFALAGKPPELYKQISDRLNVLPNRLIHIGDSYGMDVANAQSAGWAAVQVGSDRDRIFHALLNDL